MNEFVEQFILEARELVAQAADDLLALERGAEGSGSVDGVFRAFHTLKGAAGIVEFAAMGRVMHAAEEVMAEARSARKTISPKLVNDCLACLDQITRWLDQMQERGEVPADGEEAADELVRSLAGAPRAAGDQGQVSAKRDADWLERLREGHQDSLPDARTAICYRPDADAFFRGEDPLALLADIPELLVVDLAWQHAVVVADMDPFACAIEIVSLTKASAEQVRNALAGVIDQVDIVALGERSPASGLSPQARSLLEAQLLLLQVTESEGRIGRLAAAGRVCANVLRHAALDAQASAVEAALADAVATSDAARLASAIENALADDIRPNAEAKAQQTSIQPAVAKRAVRVDMARIDALVNLTGELTVVKNAFGHMAALARNGGDSRHLAAGLREQQLRFDRLVGELQRAVLRIRVLPLRQVFQRFPRLVREIAAVLGKPVKFVVEGDATEADAAIVEILFEPLLHVLRNALDHGVETPSRRAELGKPETATVVLRAKRHLDNVIVEVEDDGGGIDIGRVRQAAVARNLVSSEAMEQMADDEVVNLIFSPGFSTATEVTGLSGRGVGMDSVRAAVERIGGHASVESHPGRGAIIRLNLPFTVMITRVMTVETAGQIFGFPVDWVVETAMVPRSQLLAVGRGKAFVLRDKTVPLINLAESLGLAPTNASDGAKVVVTFATGQLGGIEVEKLGERMDVMLKPMDGLLSGMRGVAGTTLLGDGRVLLVLDIPELFQ